MNHYSQKIREYYWAAPERYRNLVKINHEKLLEFAKTLAAKEPKAPNWREPKELMPEDDQVYACHEFYRSVVNFCYTHPRKMTEKFQIGNWTGSMAMAFCFQRKFGNRAITPADIYQICESERSIAEFFAGDNQLPLLAERRAMLLEAAEVVEKEFGGDPLKIMKASDYCTGYAGVVDMLLKYFPMSFGADCFEPDAFQQLQFAKRAMLWPILWHGRAMDSKTLTPIRDPEELGLPVDYQIPKTLRHLGILECDDNLAEHIAAKAEVVRHCPSELSIRMATMAAGLKLLETINALRPDNLPRWTAVELDYELWSAGRAAKHIPHHLTLTTDY